MNNKELNLKKELFKLLVHLLLMAVLLGPAVVSEKFMIYKSPTQDVYSDGFNIYIQILGFILGICLGTTLLRIIDYFIEE